MPGSSAVPINTGRQPNGFWFLKHGSSIQDSNDAKELRHNTLRGMKGAVAE
jgi:hypothetical protein